MSLPSLSKDSPTSFAELMRLEKIGDSKFRSTMAAYEPGGNVARANGFETRSYGGHVYAQSVWAAAQTVKANFVCHNVNGYFIQPGKGRVPFEYHVQTIQDGRSFCIRAVDVTQGDAPGICFRCTCSFKKIEVNKLEYQQPVDIQQQYQSVLAGKHPNEHPEPHSYDTPWYVQSKMKYEGPPFPGLISKRVNMDRYNQGRSPSDRRQLHIYSVIGEMPSVTEQPNLHAVAHLYASDRNSLFFVTRLFDVQKYYGFTTTLCQSFIFHSSAQSLDTTDSNGTNKWFTQEVWTDRLEDSRGVHHSRLIDSNNRHIATTLQDGIVRLNFETDEEFRSIKDRLARNTRL